MADDDDSAAVAMTDAAFRPRLIDDVRNAILCAQVAAAAAAKKKEPSFSA